MLNLLAATEEGLSVSAIAPVVGLGKSTVHTLLATMRADEFVEQAKYGRHRLGLGAFHVGTAAAPRIPADGRLTPLLWTLAEDTGEAVSLAIANHRDALIVQRIESRSLLRAEVRIGTRMPLHSSASGKCLLAQMPREAVEALYPSESLSQLSTNTVRERSDLLKELAQVRRDDYAVNRNEYAAGVCSSTDVDRRRPLPCWWLVLLTDSNQRTGSAALKKSPWV